MTFFQKDGSTKKKLSEETYRKNIFIGLSFAIRYFDMLRLVIRCRGGVGCWGRLIRIYGEAHGLYQRQGK